jgi:hypothetical protein
LRYIERLLLPASHCVLVTTLQGYRDGRFWTLSGAVLGSETLPHGRCAFVPCVAKGFLFCSFCSGLVDPADTGAMCTYRYHPQNAGIAQELEYMLNDPNWVAPSKAIRRALRDFADEGMKNARKPQGSWVKVPALHPCCASRLGDPGCTVRRHEGQKRHSPNAKELITAVPGLRWRPDAKKPVVLLNLAPVVIREDNWFGELDMMHARFECYNVTAALHEHGKQ